jgi:uncharacterized protein (DUF433 family)
MITVTEMLRPTEAAVVARVALRDVNRVIDEHILPDGFFSLADGRRVAASACMFISFYIDSAKRLTSEERLAAIREVARRLSHRHAKSLASLVEADWVVRDELLTIDLSPFFLRAKDRFERLSAARDMVTSDPEILGGVPILRGTRIPVHDVAASVAAGVPISRILAAYPSLDRRRIALAALYAEANPARGRPRAIDKPPKDAAILVDRQAPRRRVG